MTAAVSSATAHPAAPLRDALAALDAAGVSYCVWKGSDHLDASLSGDGDLDLLVDPRRAADVTSIFAGTGLVRTRQDRDWLVDYLGIDAASGRLLHVQAYERLVVDDGLLGVWELPWTEAILTGRERLDGVWVAAPAAEIVLLAIRWAARPRLGYGRDWGTGDGPGSLAARLATLMARDGAAAAPDVARQWLGDEASLLLAAALHPPVDATRLAALRTAVRSVLVARRCRPRVVHAAARALATGRRGARRASRKLPERTHVRGRTADGDGLIVAVVGADGSGKSSVVGDLVATFEHKLDVLPLYMGSGNGPSSALRWPLALAKRAAERAGLRKPASGGAERQQAERSPTGAKALWAVVLAREKRIKLRRAGRARAAGALVVSDRYPQNEVLGFNDGPLLHAWSDSASPLRRRLSAWERRAYERAAANPPDLILHLAVSPGAAAARRPEHPIDDLERRIDAVASLRFPGARFGIAEISADAPYEEVIAIARRLVLEHL